MLRYSLIILQLFCTIPCEAHELEKNQTTLGQITEQRAHLESLKLEVAIEEQKNKIDTLRNPSIITLPTYNVLEPTQVSTNNTAPQLLSIHGFNTTTLEANILFQGKAIQLKQGQRFQGHKVTITRESVHFGHNHITF